MSTFRLRLTAALLLFGWSALPAPGHAAGNGRATAAATEAMLREEHLSQVVKPEPGSKEVSTLTLGLPEKKVIAYFGQPTKKGEIVLQGADGMYVQKWQYPAQGLELTMSSARKGGSKTVANFTATQPCTLYTKQGIRIGSTESAVRKAYGAYADRDTPAERGTLVAGSIYGGIIFSFAKDHVYRIFFGAAAE